MTAKFTADRDGRILGFHDGIISSSVAGLIVVDGGDLLVNGKHPDIAAVMLAKAAALRQRSGLNQIQADDMMGPLHVDISQSTKIFFGPKRRTAMQPGGRIVTLPIFLAPLGPSGFRFVANWTGFFLYMSTADEGGGIAPNQLLYNFDTVSNQFLEFDPSTFTVEVRDSLNTITLVTLSFNTSIISPPLPAGNYRFRFTNNHPSRIFNLSDWIIAYD